MLTSVTPSSPKPTLPPIMRDFVILLGSSSIVTPCSASHHRHPIKPQTSSSLPKLTPFHSTPSSSYSPLNTLQVPFNHYARLTSTLARDGKLHGFEMVLEGDHPGVVDDASSQIVPGLNVEDLAEGVLVGIRGRKVRAVINALKKVEELGVSLSAHFDGPAMEIVGKECCRLVKCGYIEEAVELMEVLTRFHLSVRELVQPSDIIRRCVISRNPNLAVRYACLLPHAQILFCNIICEFGKRRDLISALKAYDASMKNLNSPNMYIYRAIIDVCGLCGDFMKSRYIYEDLLNQKITPNIYVFNSLMNVNSHDLGYTLNLYQKMQHMISFSYQELGRA